jgi:hypothetical protein
MDDDKTDGKNGSAKHIKQKHVGDETPNPLPVGSKPRRADSEVDEKEDSST